MSGSKQQPSVPGGAEQAKQRPVGELDFDIYSQNYDEVLHESTKLYAEDSEYFAKYKVDLVKKCMRHPVARVLEYGCGTGRNIPYLQEAFPGAQVVGTDVSAGSLEVAAMKNPEARFELEKSELDVGRFDLIFVASVFHHIPPVDRADVMKTLTSRLSPQGALNVFEHNPYNPVTRRIVDNCPFDADAVLLKPAELDGLFELAGIGDRKLSYCLFVPPRLSWLAPIENLLGWLPLGGQYWVRGKFT